MSGTSSTPHPDKPALNRWLKYIGEEDGNADTTPIESRKALPLVSVDLYRVQRLIEQLEMRSLAAVNYGYGPRPEARPLLPAKMAIMRRLLAPFDRFAIYQRGLRAFCGAWKRTGTSLKTGCWKASRLARYPPRLPC